MSLYTLGNTECPPHGAMKSESVPRSFASNESHLHMMRPKLRGRVAQFSGKRNVLAGWRREPGASGLINPSTQMRMTTLIT